MEQQDMKMCQKHKLEIILVDLDIKIGQEDRCLCVRCIIERMNKKKMNLIDETKNMIKEMKMNEQNQRIKDNKKRLDNFNNIELLLRELKQNIDCIFDKIFNNIQSKLNLIQRDIGNLESQSFIYDFEDDIERLSQYQEYQINEQSIKLIEDDHQFIEQIQKQLESFINSEQYKKLMNNSIILMNSKIEQDQINNEQTYEIIKAQDYKTPALKLICQEHTKEIIMFNLNSNSNSQPRLACVKCIQQYPSQYTHLEDVSIQWDSYQKRNQSNLNEIYNTRNCIQQKILQMIQDIKLQTIQIFDELIQSLNNQQQSIEQMNSNQINIKSIQQLTFNQINEIINQLSQIDKLKTYKDHKINIEKIDNIFYSDLRSRFEHLIQYQQINIQRFNQILINDNKVINEIDNILQLIQNKDEDNKQESIDLIEQIRQFMYKSLNFEFSQKVFIQTIDQYVKVKEDMHNIQQILTNKLEKSQEFQCIFNEFNNYLDKFNQNYIQFQQFLEIDEKFNENNQLKEQIETVQKEKQEQKIQIENDLNKMKEINEKINKQYLEQKNQLEQQIKVKDEDIMKLKESIEQIQKEYLNLEQNVNNLVPTYKTLFKIVSSQYQKQLTFSQTHKYSNCEVTQNGKMVQNGYYCLCDQVIPKNGVTSFAFKIIQLSSGCFIGIGMREIIQKNNYGGNVTFGYGSYTIRQDKYCYSHHDKDKDNKQLSFDFAINDIIIVEVDIQNKNIKWTKVYTNQSFNLQIDTTYDLYPCLWVNGNKVQIVEQLV